MRIITGIARGIKLKAPKGLDVRPTADRVKESIFNILANMSLPFAEDAVVGARVLDLFAGTGNLGLEALSRGAEQALFIDHSSTSLAVIRDNIYNTKLSELAEVQRGDSVKILAKLSQLGRTFTLVFVDPPYNQGLVNEVLLKLDSMSLVENGGIIVVEHSKHEMINAEWHCLKLIRTEHYGETYVTFLLRECSHTI